MIDIEQLVKQLIGKKLGPYIITRFISSGGMGGVCEGLLDPYEVLRADLLAGGGTSMMRAMVGLDEGDIIKEQDTKMIEAKVRTLSKELSAKFIGMSPAEQQKYYQDVLEYLDVKQQLQDCRRAIKILDPALMLNPKLSLEDKVRIVERFKQEIKAQSKINHPNVVKVIEAGEAMYNMKEKGDEEVKQIPVHYAAIEYVDVARSLDKGLFTNVDDAVRVAYEALKGLIAVHEYGLIHRDIKPANILLSKTGEVKLADFGLAKATASSSSMTAKNLTATGAIIGTPSFINPEQARGEKAGKESDIYCLGATLYHFITGQPPVDTKDRPVLEILAEIGQPTDTVAWIRNKKPIVSDELEDIVMMTLAKTREDRPTAYELRSQLEYLMQEKLLTYRSSTEKQETERVAKIASLKRDAKSWKVGAKKHLSRAETYGELGMLYARTKEETNLRIDAFENALAEYTKLAENNAQTVLAADDLDVRMSELRKYIALEYRRLQQLGVARTQRQPKNHMKNFVRAGIAAAALGIAALAGNHVYQNHQLKEQIAENTSAAALAISEKNYSSARRLLDVAEDASKDLPASSELVKRIKAARIELGNRENYDNASQLHQAASAHLKEGKYSDADAAIKDLRKSLEKIQAHSPEFRKQVEELEAKVNEEEKKIGKIITDVKIYNGLIELFGKVSADYDKLDKLLKEDKFFAPKEIDDMTATLDDITGKITVINPEVDPKFEEKVNAVMQAKAKLPVLRKTLDTNASAYFSKQSKKLDGMLAAVQDYTKEGVAEQLKGARDVLKAAEDNYKKINSDELKPAYEQLTAKDAMLKELETKAAQYSVFLKQAKDGTNGEKVNANTQLVKIYLGVGRVSDAEKCIAGIPDKSGLENHVKIIDLEKKAADPQQMNKDVLRQLSDAYKQAGYDKRAEFVLQKIPKD